MVDQRSASPTELHHGIDGAVPADIDEDDVVAWMNSTLTTVMTVAATSVGAARCASAALRDETPNGASAAMSRVAMSGRDVSCDVLQS